MPFKSDAQRRWAHTEAGKEALGGAAKVAEWDSASKGMNLPERKGPSSIAETFDRLRPGGGAKTRFR
jgi:hypothetical protein